MNNQKVLFIRNLFASNPSRDKGKIEKAFAESATDIITMAVRRSVLLGKGSNGFTDAKFLEATLTSEVTALARLYGIPKNPETDVILNDLILTAAAGLGTRSAINTLHDIMDPHFNPKSINGIIAGSVASVLGYVSLKVFKGILSGEIDPADKRKIYVVSEHTFSIPFFRKIMSVLSELHSIDDTDEITDFLLKLSPPSDAIAG